MKKLIILTLFLSTLTFGQFFEQSEPDYGADINEQKTYQPYAEYAEPVQGVDADVDPNPGGEDPDPVPINNWQFLLTLTGVGVGVWFLRKRYKAV